MSEKVKEFVEKLRKLEKEYEVVYLPENPFTFMYIVDKDFYYDQDGEKIYDRAKDEWL